VSGLQYDTVNGVKNGDSGSGPPTWASNAITKNFGWVRTGNDSNNGVGIGANCAAWTSNGAPDGSSNTGSAVGLVNTWGPPNVGPAWPWLNYSEWAPTHNNAGCNMKLPVWCVQS